MANQIVNYQCPACTGPLHFSGESGRLECEYCGSSYEVQQIEEMYAAKEQAAAENMQKKSGDGWDESGLSQDWGGAEQGMRAYSCPSCGAELICDETTAATSCPYCGNPTVVPGQFSGSLKPDYVIPFQVSKEQAIEALKKHYHGKVFLPSAFTAQQQLEKVQGVYVPFWLFDGEISGSCSFSAEHIERREDSDEVIIRTEHYRLHREGSLRFEKVPVDASTKMPDGHMDALEPYDYSKLKPFSSAYLPGFLADKYDQSVQQTSQRADERCENTFLDAMRESAFGYDTCTLDRKQTQLARGKVHYALLPVWLMHVGWNNKSYLFAINGQTGKAVGDLPISRSKYLARLALMAAGLGVAGHLLAQLLFW